MRGVVAKRLRKEAYAGTPDQVTTYTDFVHQNLIWAWCKLNIMTEGPFPVNALKFLRRTRDRDVKEWAKVHDIKEVIMEWRPFTRLTYKLGAKRLYKSLKRRYKNG